jgi:homoserine dehydrogenase
MATTTQRTIRIGLLGFGTVGQGVWKHLHNNRAVLARRLGVDLEIARVGVRDLKKKRAVKVPRALLTTDLASIVDDPKIDIVCELIGGVTTARELTTRALQLGKVVVTGNKALLCEHGAELFRLVQRGHGHYFFEASVAGGIPIIKVLREGLIANRFRLIYGILNGTCNYILTRMAREGRSFAEVLADAKRLGYAEADESLDVDGWDAAHKAVILAYLAHGRWIKPRQMLVQGIRDITPHDLSYARELGYTIKLLAIISRDFSTNRVFARVHPCLLPAQNLLASVDDVFNGICLSADVAGSTLLVGRGAGQDATASAVLSDIADAVVALRGAPAPVICEEDADTYTRLGSGIGIASLAEITGRYYLRLTVHDRPGVLAEVARALADHEISIATMIQHEDRARQTAEIIFTTHTSNEQSMHQACRHLKKLRAVPGAPFLLRILEDEGL